jgi:hypothetical protein
MWYRAEVEWWVKKKIQLKKLIEKFRVRKTIMMLLMTFATTHIHPLINMIKAFPYSSNEATLFIEHLSR